MPLPGEVMRGRTRRSRGVVLIPLVAAALGTLGVLWLAGAVRGPTDEELVIQVTTEYVAAWEAGDWAAMAALTTDPGTLQEAHEQAAQALRITSTAVAPSVPLVDVEDGTAEVDLTVRWELEGIGPHEHAAQLALRRVDLPAADANAEPETAWRVVWTPAALHPDLTVDRRFERVRVFRPRAPILAADGTPLVDATEVVVIGLEPRRMSDPGAVLAALDAFTDADAAAAATVLDAANLVPDRFYPLTELDRGRYDAVRDQLQPVPGLVFRTRQARASLVTPGLRQLLGSTGEVTAEQLAELGEPYATGDVVGQSGLERVHERQLAGEPDREARIIELDGTLVRSLVFVDGSDPLPVRTGLDPALQADAEAATEGVAQPMALVALHVPTGQVRAVVSRPFDGFNRALAGRYPPGSTFKIVTAAAALRAGHGPDSVVDCPPVVRLGGREFRNAGGDGPGPVTLTAAFERSCNTAFAALGAAMGAEHLKATAEQVGFNVPLEVGLPTFAGSFPEPADTTEVAAAAIGQGRVESSVLHMASVAAAGVSGVWRSPRIVVIDAAPEERPLDPALPPQLVGLLRAVVVSGTAAAAGLPDAPDGALVVGKTGSAEFGTEVPPPTHAWFVGVRGDLAFAVVVEGGGAGGAVAAPIAARFLSLVDSAP